MILQRIRRAAAVLALAATFALAAPVHAAGWEELVVAPGWFGQALEWVGLLWIGAADATGLTSVMDKGGYGLNPDGSCSGASSPSQSPTSNSASDSGG